MIFEKHLELAGKHALLAPSQPHWLQYDEEKLFERYVSRYATDIGTILHSLAETLIKHRLKLKKSDKLTVMVHLLENGIPRNIIDIDRIYENFMNYVNDAVGFRLTPEQILYYSEYCFGTADTISFRDNFLRIHDYKSGTVKPKIEQLLVYAALFCLEYKVKPGTLAGCELRIYWNDQVLIHNPEADEILPIMDVIIRHDKYLKRMNEEV